ncbi:hypothetical protein M422DRAFT_33410 [Sphaerobolus stellatus SS14]|uniref:Ricin B lectin domain-containing protein n=1 Tax=Sphaerobolus stellatus (strain SS14) TaxID=990650 RepID=A0A0C9VKN5_SPHS4|nr:hypothetical protein M422DRAFT_33410 [Sphaerobolus stellatus SS14]
MSLPTGGYAIKNIPTNTFLTIGQTHFQSEGAPIVGLPGPPNKFAWWVVNNTGNNNYEIPWVQFGVLQPEQSPAGFVYPHGQPVNLATQATATGLVSWTIEAAQNGLFTISASGVFLQMWNEGTDAYSPITAEMPTNDTSQMWQFIRLD